MRDSFGMEVLKTLKNGHEGVDDFLFFKVDFVTGMNALTDFCLKRSHSFFVKNPRG